MTRKLVLGGFAALAMTLVASVPGFAQDPPASPSQEEMMKKWQEAATPGANHKALEKFVGNWTYTNRMWMDPSAPPSESAGKANMSMILGGRYLQQNYTGDFMGQPFEGFGLMGYDNLKKEYVNTWTDNTSTTIMSMNGKNGENGEIVLVGAMDDPATQKSMKLREVIRWTGDDSFVVEMYDTSGPKEFKTMEIAHTRVK